MSRLALLAASLSSFIVVAGCSADTSDTSDDAPSPAAASTESAQTANGRIGVHGMVAFGERSDAAYLSHIPMFGAPHDVQMIVRGSFVGANVPSALGDKLYTYKPSVFSLDALRLGQLREITGTLYLGNFEDGGRPIASGVKFRVTQVVHQHILDARAPATTADDVIELDGFTAHLIGGAPSYDEIKTESGKVLSCLEGPDFVVSCLNDQR